MGIGVGNGRIYLKIEGDVWEIRAVNIVYCDRFCLGKERCGAQQKAMKNKCYRSASHGSNLLLDNEQPAPRQDPPGHCQRLGVAVQLD